MSCPCVVPEFIDNDQFRSHTLGKTITFNIFVISVSLSESNWLVVGQLHLDTNVQASVLRREYGVLKLLVEPIV